MKVLPLPDVVADLLFRLGASPRLVAHLTLVHDVACTLTARLDTAWPTLNYDRAAVRMGAAIHDIGKTSYSEELTHPGHAHELAGEELLRSQGFPDALSRFARTHAQWMVEPTFKPEDLLVAAADTWWRGKRNDQLESAIGQWIAQQMEQPQWQVFVALDDIATDITAQADTRLQWQQQFALRETDR